jgi:hypothetical protein
MDMHLLAELVHTGGAAVARILLVDPLLARVRWDDNEHEHEHDESVVMAMGALRQLAAFWPDSPVHCYSSLDAYARACREDATLRADVLIEVGGREGGTRETPSGLCVGESESWGAG